MTKQYPTYYRGPAANDDGARILAIGVLVLSALFTVTGLVAEVPFTRATLDYADSREPSDAVLLAVVVMSFGYLALLVPLWIVTCLWLRAERVRLSHDQGDHFKHGTAGTFFSWIVPFANFVWPMRVVREVHEAAVESSQRVPIGAWWAAWLVSFLSSNVSTRLSNAQGVGDPAGTIIVLSVVENVALLVALFYWWRIVQTTSRGGLAG